MTTLVTPINEFDVDDGPAIAELHRLHSGQRAAYAHPAGTSAGSTGRPGMLASGASRSVAMSGTAALCMEASASTLTS